MALTKSYLLTPGPTPVPEDALLSMAKPIIHHRTPEFMEIFKEVSENLKYVFQTQYDVLVFTASGTGAMEAAVCNLLSPGDKAITVQGGKFGERWTEICRAYNITALPIDVEWGKAVNPKDIEALLKQHSDVQAVFTTLCETSTGVHVDVKTIAEMMKKYNAVLVVDAISGLGAVDIKTDEWGIDCVVAGSQKGLMIPPGLAFVSLSKKAWEKVEQSKSPKYYFDFKATKKAIEKTDTPFTPAITLVIALRETLRMMKQEGLDVVFSRHRKLANATRAAMKAMGLELFAPTAPSDCVTAVKVPAGIDGEKLVKLMRDKYGVGIAGGQAELKGKVFRIAHMGFIRDTDIVTAINVLTMALMEMGYKCDVASGINALMQELMKK
ncbi:MAG: alanine--glyoxylate aminotransferase family protein [Candidatus Omnitrophota bacterium]